MTRPELSTASPLPPLDPNGLSSRSAPKVFIFLAAALLIITFAACWQKIDSGAILFHLKTGQVIRKTGQVPNHDIFSAGASVKVWSYIEWYWAGVLAYVWELAKWPGVNLLGLALMPLTALLTLWRCRIHGGRWFESLVVIILMSAALLPGYGPTPAMAAMSLFAVALIAAEARRLWPMILLPLLTMFWANIHAGYLLPLLIPAARLLLSPPNRDQRQSTSPLAYLAVIIVGGFCGALITPHSSDIIQESIGRFSGHFAEFIDDPVGSLLDRTFLIQGVAALVLVVFIVLGRRRLMPWEILVTAVLALLGIVSHEVLMFLLLYLTGPASRGLSQFMNGAWDSTRIRNVAGAADMMFCVTALALVLWAAQIEPDSFGAGLKHSTFPETAAGRLTALPMRESILNSGEEGDYLIWRLWPGWKICMDERPTLYDEEFRSQYEKLWQGGQGWNAMFTLWRVSAVMGNNAIALRYPEHNLFYELADSQNWQAVYWDSKSILYLKKGIDLKSTNLSRFRELKPGLSWAAQSERVHTPLQWHNLAADLRRALLDDPSNVIAREFYQRTKKKIGK